MPLPTTRYDTQLIERFGSIDAFRRRRDSRDPAVWGPALDHIRIAETENGLQQLLCRLCTLTGADSRPGTELVARLDAVLNDMYTLLELREDAAYTLELQLDLTAPEAEPAAALDPHARLTPAPGTTRATAKTVPPPTPTCTGTHTPGSRTPVTAFDARIEALVGDLDRLRARTDRPPADPGLHELITRHDALTDAETACHLHRVRVNTLTDGRWYIDSPLVDTIDQAITDLEAHITTRDSHARTLNRHLARLEAAAAHDPARSASPIPAEHCAPTAQPPLTTRRSRNRHRPENR